MSIVGYYPSEQKVIFMGIKKRILIFDAFVEGGTSGWIVTQLKLSYNFIEYKIIVLPSKDNDFD